MTVGEFIERLSVLDPNMEIVYYDRLLGERLEPVLNIHVEFDSDLVCIVGRPGDR